MPRSVSTLLFSHGAVYTASRVANQSIGFLLLPLYAHLLGEDGYGVISVLAAVSAFLGFIFFQGLQGSWFRLRFEYADERGVRDFETTIVWYLVAVAIAGVGLLAVVGEPLARVVMPGIPFFPLGLLATVAAAAAMFPMLYERRLQVEQKPLRFAIFSLIRTVLLLAGVVLFVVGLGRGVRGKLEAEAVVGGVTAVLALALLRPGSPRRFSADGLRRALAYGVPLVPHHLAGLANDLIDRVLLNAMLGASAAGIYSAGYQVASLGMIIAVALNQAYSPMFIATMKQAEQQRAAGDEEGARASLESLARAGLHTVAAIACVSIGITAFGREVLQVLTPAGFEESWRVVALVAAGTLVWGLYFPFAQAIFYDVRRARYITVVTISAALVNVAANYVLIPRLGVMGAAWATLISNACMTGLAIVIGQTSTRLDYRWVSILGVLSVAGLGIAILWVVDSLVASVEARLLMKGGLGAGAIIGVAWIAAIRWRNVIGLLSRARG